MGARRVLGLATVAPLAIGADVATERWLGPLHQAPPDGTFVIGALGYLLALTVAMFAAHLLAKLPVRLRFEGARLATVLVLAASASMAGLALQKRMTHGDSDTWMARTMELGGLGLQAARLPDDVDVPCHYLGGPPGRSCPPPVRATLLDIPAAVATETSGELTTCRVQVVDEAGRDATLTFDAHGPGLPCFTFDVLRVEGTMWLVARMYGFATPPPRAFLDPDHVEQRVTSVAWLARWLAPPLPWSLSALAGLLVAIGLMVVPRDRALGEKLAWREETRHGVALLVRPDAPTETYRRALDVTDATNVVPGTHASARLAWKRQRAGRWAFAGMTALLFATPLLVAVMRGLLR